MRTVRELAIAVIGGSLASIGFGPIGGIVAGFLLFAASYIGESIVVSRKSPLRIVFDPNDRECVQKRDNHPNRDLQLRVRVTNTGKKDVSQTRLRLCEREPHGHDHLLRIRHDNAPPYALSNAGVLCPSRETQAVYFDVVFEQLGRTNVVFQYADEYLLQEQILPVPSVPRAVHLFTLEAQGVALNGKAVPSRRVRIRLDPVGTEDLTLTLF